MAKVLILGNITKDTYISISPDSVPLEKDHHTSWLDLPFNSTSTPYFAQSSIFGGAAITLEVLNKFGIDATIHGTSVIYETNSITVPTDTPLAPRFILSVDTGVHYFRPETLPTTNFSPPKTAPDLIFIDRSAHISRDLSDKLLSYLLLSTSTRLALFISHHTDIAKDYIQKLIARADLIITDTDHFANYHITENSIYTLEHAISLSPSDKRDLTTDLTTHSIIAATLLSATILREDQPTALLLAKFNIENSTLNGTVSANTLKEQIMDQNWQVKNITDLRATAQKLLATGKGILAADESGGSIHKKFESMDIPDDEQHRRDYRNIFFTTRDLEKYASGVILFDETARQKADDGTDFVTFLGHRGIIPGIKVDQGLEKLGSGETITKGLDGLPARLTEYYNLGLRFAKWRAAFELTDTTPSDQNIADNCDILARYALDCQIAGIVPIVEPELVYDGDYTIEQSATATTKILKQLIASLTEHQVDLAATIVKTNMVLAGKKHQTQSSPEEVGRATAEVLRTSLPDNLAGVVFLSGGQSVDQATENLQAVTDNGPFPWPVTFSFARALQDPALTAWKGDNANSDTAREAFLTRLIANTQALQKKPL